MKTWPEPFIAILDGRKRFEIRRNDRGFMVGDLLILQEWDPALAVEARSNHRAYPEKEAFTRRDITVVVTYVAPGGSWGLPADMCVMGFDVGKTDLADALRSAE